MPSAGWSYELDRDVIRSTDGRLLVGGTPARLIRLSDAGRVALDACLAGRDPYGPAGGALVDRLVEGGLLHPRAPAAQAPITFVVPVRDGARWLRDLVGALRTDGPVIVVDDDSTDDSAEIARAAGARVLASTGPPGPSAARNTGLAAADTELVAFVDADCVVAPGWTERLVGLFEDPALALVAPRVRGVPGPTLLERYETSPSAALDLGRRPGLVGPGRRLGYIPSAASVARHSAMLDAGGFDAQLSIAEDVDLVIRLVRSGYRVRYAPHVVVEHHPRASVKGFAQQRARYGRSAVLLEARHPGTTAPLHVDIATLDVWVTGALLGPGAAALTASAVRRRRSRALSGEKAAHLRRLNRSAQLQATRHLVRAIARDWLPPLALASLKSRRARRALLLASAAEIVLGLPRNGSLRDLLAHVAYRPVDHMAYAAGLWREALRLRRPVSILPRVTSPVRRGEPSAAQPREPTAVPVPRSAPGVTVVEKIGGAR